jgi:hypothetical protein
MLWEAKAAAQAKADLLHQMRAEAEGRGKRVSAVSSDAPRRRRFWRLLVPSG